MDPASLTMGSKIRFAGQTGRKFNLKPLSHHNFVGEIPSRFGNFALGIQTFGVKQYKESTVSLAYGRRIKQRLRMISHSSHSQGVKILFNISNASKLGLKIRVNYLDFSFNSNVDISGGLFIQAAL